MKIALTDLAKDELLKTLAELPCNPGGRQSYLRALKAFYSWAEESGLIERSPAYKLTIKVPKPLRRVDKVGDLPRLLSACRSHRDRLIISMLANTGVRISGLLSV